MLTQISPSVPTGRNQRRTQGLWYDGDQKPLSIGCTVCPDRPLCGGLRLASSVYDCLSLCCGRPKVCDAVCRNAPKRFVERLREVGGFELASVPRSAALSFPNLPEFLPIFYHPSRRASAFGRSPVVALPLYKVIGRHYGGARYLDKAELARGFGLAPTTTIVLTGTDRDKPLERWWNLGTGRRFAIRSLRSLGVSMVTTPNFSLFTDQPRWDDLHSIKRIALVFEEFMSEGLPAALHLNARTDLDWSRWTEFLSGRPEITHVSFEFGTGAGYTRRMDWHVQQLQQLASRINHPLHLILRGGMTLLPRLRKAFAGVTMLDTTVFVKTTRRQRLDLAQSGKASWIAAPTAIDANLDELLDDNWSAASAVYEKILQQTTQ